MSFRVPHDQDEGMRQPPPNEREPLRFPLALKQARLGRHMKQETLAAQLHVKVRTLVSWETGTRLPSIGMVALLSDILTGAFDLEHDLVLTYIADDLARQIHLQEDEEVRRRALRLIEQLQAKGDKRTQEQEPHLSLFGNLAGERQQEFPQNHDEGAARDRLRQLFAVLEMLRERPELLPVVQDFLREVTLPSTQ